MERQHQRLRSECTPMPPRHLHERACHRVQTSVEATVPPLTRAHVSSERRLKSQLSHVQGRSSQPRTAAHLSLDIALGACVRMSMWV